jgi:competence protein ComEC
VVLVALSVSWVLGIWLGASYDVPAWLLAAGAVPLASLLVTRRSLKPVLAAATCLVLLSGAGLYAHHALYHVDEASLRYYNDLGAVRVRGIVSSDPDVRESSTRLEVTATSLELDGRSHDVSGTLLVFVDRYPSYRYGDEVLLAGELLTPPQLDDFDYRGYLAHRGIYSLMRYPDVAVTGTGGGNPVLAGIYDLRQRLADSLSASLPEPQASLARALVLGDRGGLPDDVRAQFNRSGAAHLLAVSGLHLGIMAGILLATGTALFGRRRYLYVWFALAGVWAYAVLTGLNPPVVRGAIMASLFLLAEALGRQRSGFIALAFAAAVMTAVSPYVLGDAAFQLSFLAMSGLVFLFPLLRDGGRNLVSRRLGGEGVLVTFADFTVDVLSATLGALVAVWPVVAWYFGTVALAGPLVNFLALPALPAVIVLGGLAALCGLAVPVVGQAVGWLAWLFLSWLLLVTGWLGGPGGAVVAVSPFPPVLLWLYYIVLAAAVWLLYRWRRRNPAVGAAGRLRSGVNLGFGLSFGWRWLIVPLAVLALLTTVTAFTYPDDDVHVAFLDVGQGDATLVTRGTTQVLVDGGPGPGAVMTGLADRMPFWDRTIEVVVLSHPHEDHLGGLVEVLRRYDVKNVIEPPLTADTPLVDEWDRLLDEKGIVPVVVTGESTVTFSGGLSFDITCSISSGSGSEDLPTLVVRVDAGGAAFLLTADITAPAELDLVHRRADLRADILQVPHHGSAGSSSVTFLAVTNPAAAVVSCGLDNPYGHPAPETLARLDAAVGADHVYRTDEQGSIDFIWDGERLRVYVEKR